MHINHHDKNLQLLCDNCNRQNGGKFTMTKLKAMLATESMKFG